MPIDDENFDYEMHPYGLQMEEELAYFDAEFETEQRAEPTAGDKAVQYSLTAVPTALKSISTVETSIDLMTAASMKIYEQRPVIDGYVCGAFSWISRNGVQHF
jgi:hypothetical protein